MQQKKGWATATNNQVDFNIANRNLFLPEIFEHKQLLYSICQAFSFILLQKTKATRFRVANFFYRKEPFQYRYQPETFFPFRTPDT
ncbi:MAG: hypothetical protein P8Y84_12640 [Desulfuromonadales bacterium]